MAIQFANSPTSVPSGVSMRHVNPRHRDVAAPSRGERIAKMSPRQSARGLHVDAIAVLDVHVAVDIQAHQFALLGCSLRRINASRPIKSSGLGFERHGEADARLERVGLVGEVVSLQRSDPLRRGPYPEPLGPSVSDRGPVRPPRSHQRSRGRVWGGTSPRSPIHLCSRSATKQRECRLRC